MYNFYAYSGNDEKAYNDLNYVYEYSKDKKIVPFLEDGKSIFYHATYNLVHVCLNVAKNKLENNLVRESGPYFNDALKFAKESNSTRVFIS